MLRSKDYVAPYNSRGKRISKSSHHPDMWLITMIGTVFGYNITMSTQLMLQNNPPDPEPQKGKRHLIVSDFSRNEVTILQSYGLPSIMGTGRVQSSKPNKSARPRGLADIK